MIKKEKSADLTFFYCFGIYIMAKCKLLYLRWLLELRWGILTHLNLRKRLIYSDLCFSEAVPIAQLSAKLFREWMV